MAYTKQTWADLPSKTTPINAERLTHIEDGIYNAAATADTAASNASSAISGLANKVDKEPGKGLSSNDFTDALKTKLDNIETGAEVNVQSDWDEDDSSSDTFILNKPTLGTASTKNSTSVVTSSSDLVESGAVYSALQGKANNTVITNNIETGTTYSRAYAVREHFINNGVFRTVKSEVSSGDTITDNNSFADTVGNNLIKQVSFNVTTNASGVANLCNNDRIVLAIKSAGHVVQNYVTGSGSAINIKSYDYQGNLDQNVNITGVYFYI